MLKLDFTNKTAVISGGGTGIGFSIAKSFLSSGANIIISGRREKMLKKAVEELKNHKKNELNKIIGISCDMSLEKDVIELIDKTINQFSNLDIFVNNASVWFTKSILDLTEEDISSSFSNILKSTIIGTKFASQAMTRGGVIINMASFAGIMAMKNASLYSSFKSGVINFTRSAASELAELNIRVNCVIPGVIRTPMTSNYIDENYDKIVMPIPLKRVGKIEEVANGVLFLSSELASYITGACLEITGGKYSTQL